MKWSVTQLFPANRDKADPVVTTPASIEADRALDRELQQDWSRWWLHIAGHRPDEDA